MVPKNMLRTYEVKWVFSKRKLLFSDVTKCLQQFEIPDLFHICAPCSELPSNIHTKDLICFPLQGLRVVRGYPGKR